MRLVHKPPKLDVYYLSTWELACLLVSLLCPLFPIYLTFLFSYTFLMNGASRAGSLITAFSWAGFWDRAWMSSMRVTGDVFISLVEL